MNDIDIYLQDVTKIKEPEPIRFANEIQRPRYINFDIEDESENSDYNSEEEDE